MASHSNSSGFSIVEVLIVLVAVGVLGFVGYGVYSHRDAKTASSKNQSVTADKKTQTVTTDDHTTAAPDTIKTETDLNTTEQALDESLDSASNDTTDLDKELSAF